jgi:hypothetical protein
MEYYEACGYLDAEYEALGKLPREEKIDWLSQLGASENVAEMAVDNIWPQK